MRLNENRNRQGQRVILVADLIDHYIETELSDETEWRAQSTRLIHADFLKRWVHPFWGTTNIREVRTVAVEAWLRQLRRKDCERSLANATKAKIRNVMSVIFNHAIRYEWLEQGRNPIRLVRQSTKRMRTPEVLEPFEIHNLLSELETPFRLMVLLDATKGLRRSELLALKWCDVDFSSLTIDIRRSIYCQRIGNCKTEASRRPVPLDLDVAADLWLWKESTRYPNLDDWVFASPRAKGQYPYRPDTLLAKHIRPAAVRAKIKKHIGWHTFRRTYSTLLIDNGENVKVTQELMRHATTRCTLDVYSQARMDTKREAQQRVVKMILTEETSEILLRRRGPDERSDNTP
jgi:integrase